MRKAQPSWPARLGLAFVALWLLGGCGARAPLIASSGAAVQPTPTVAPIFGQPPTMPPAVLPTRTSEPTRVPTPLPPTEIPLEERLRPIVVYDDALSPGWSLEHSSEMRYDEQSAAFVAEDRYAIQAVAEATFSSLFFTVNQGARESFPREEILGLRFRLSGGRGEIPNDGLAVAVVGSNRQPYWVANDTSVQLEGRVTEELPLFPETRLYYLNINNTIPPGEWVEVYLWLDDLVYDPEYTYITGFYLKTDGLARFYVDQVELLTMP
jgi:hypothetical protein